MKLSNRTQCSAVLGLTLLAFALRAYRLGAQSFWIDEALTLHYASLPADQLWHVLQTTEITPPLYYYVIMGWKWLVGTSEYAIRFCSLVLGVMSVPLTYRLGKSLGDVRLGIVAALLMAVAPYQIWHSQDARQYAMFTAASIVSMWSFVAMWQCRGRRWILLYILGTEWALMTHYHALALIGVQGLFLLVTGRRQYKDFLKWVMALAVVLAVFAVRLFFGFGMLKGFHSWVPQPSLWETFTRSAVAYSVGELVPYPQAALLTVAFLALYALGLYYAARRRWGVWNGTEMLVLMLAYTLAPNLAAWVVGELRSPV